MQLNGVVFPAPECSYQTSDFPGELLYIPRSKLKTLRPSTTTAIIGTENVVHRRS